ncbi:MAG: SusC/RagA family TonB-linked outer membrane protein [bacterium]|nr:SusC/RagA family TonB-linked outer membrane protein [bacterium]MDD6026673.1 SusC/RagA family TonB-linked outer membrane protein [bacterium]
MKKQLLLIVFSLFAVAGYARVITGTVVSESDNEPIIGATIMVKGTQRGIATDIDGKFAIDVNEGDVLSITNVGMLQQTVKIGKQQSLNIVMKEDSKVLGEIVVTAMGQTQEKKKLNFAVQSLNSDEISAGVSNNLASTLQGKVSGLQILSTGGSPNSAQTIQIRAISSINTSQNNEPLIIIDGVPVRGGGSSLSDINPNDIESMSVLKGAAASALYGQEAANGVIMIVTKSGKDGKLQVTANATLEVSNATRVPEIQSSYAPGSKGFYVKNAGSGGWGAPLAEGEAVYDNVGEFLKTGLLQKYDVSMTGGTQRANAYASVSYQKNDGVVPKDHKDQFNVFIKGQFNPSDKVKIQLTSSFKESTARGFGNAMSSIYGWGINKNMADYQTLEGYPNWEARYDHWEEVLPENRITAAVSPYFGRYNDRSETTSTRIMLNGQISYEPIKNLVITGKVSYDKGYSMYDAAVVPRFRQSDFDDPNASYLADYAYKFGSYTFQPSRSERFNAQGLITYQRELVSDFNVNVLLGVDWSNYKSLSSQLAGQRFMLEGDFYSFQNIDPTTFTNSSSSDYYLYLTHSNWNKFGYFGELRFDYRSIAQVSVTGRLDGSSTLRQVDCTYFYPSVTAGLIFSELFKIQSNVFSYGKIRGNWAKVGKSCTPYKFSDTFKNWSTFPDGGWGNDPTVGKALNLEPEMTKSWEIGADLRFFRNRTRLDVAYYSTTVDNQIVTVRVSPAAGQILQTRNEGSVENYGIEATLAQDIFKTKDFDWTVTANFSLNRGKVKSLPDQIKQIDGTNYGGIYPTAFLGGSSTGITGKDYVRDPEGNIVCNEDGYPLVNTSKQLYIGNREPDFMLGVGSSFRYRDLSVGFLFDGRCGGDVVNITGSSLISNGQHHLLDKYRNREVVFKGVVQNADGSYSPNTTPIILDQTFINTYFYPVSSNFIEDGSYIRLSYVTVGYDLSKLLVSNCPVKGLNVTLTGRNLFLLTKYSGSDPQVTESGSSYGSGSGGFDRYGVPKTRSFNISVKATF